MGKLGYSGGQRLELSKAHCMLVLSSVERQKPNQLRKTAETMPHLVGLLGTTIFWFTASDTENSEARVQLHYRSLHLGQLPQLSNKLRIQLLTRTLASREDRNVGVRSEQEPTWIIGYGANCGQQRLQKEGSVEHQNLHVSAILRSLKVRRIESHA